MTTHDPKGMFWCEYCGQYQPEADMVDDDEPTCQSCYENKLDSYKDAFDDMAGHPMEALKNITALKGRNGGKCL